MHPPQPGVPAGHNQLPMPGVGASVPEPERERIGRYELVRRLGSGGMAEVHLARASGLEGFEKLVVLKRILPHLSADPHFIKMFLAEARLAAILDHPNVVQVFDLGYDAGDYFFTMEFVYGENLQGMQRTARRAHQRVPFEVAIGIGIGVATGLHYAHERVGWNGEPLGIVHRDVSPTNVMVTFDGCVKVADFGIAKVTNRTDVTRAGMRKGKVPYMSPEQCRAEKLDRRSDLFSLGIVLYECTTGTRLFDGDNEFGVMNRIVNGDIQPPSAIRPGYPKELERIVMRALAVDKNRRYSTAQELQYDLERLAREHKLDVSPGALSRWMHDMFSPQPYPWGALMGDGGASSGPSSVSTHADMHGSTPSSGPGVPGSSPEVTGHEINSWVPPQSAPGYASASHIGSLASIASVAQARKEGQLRGLAIGLVSVAAVAALSVGGLFAYRHLVAGSAAEASVAQEDENAGAAAGDDDDAAAGAEGKADADPVPGEPPSADQAAIDAAVTPSGDGDVVAVQDEDEDEDDGDGDGETGRKSKTRTSKGDRDAGRAKSDRKSDARTDKKSAKSDGSGDKSDGESKPNLDAFMPQ